jgi:DNA-directed RNA polymerase subunit RPC12/RpoP/cbb3-type cytochrome oxidase subunit 3
MIQFKCIYCGHSLTAQEEERGKKGRCPKCNHDFFVPKKPDPKIAKDRFIPKFTSPLDFSEFYNEFFYKTDSFKDNFKWLIPTYDDLSLFLTAFTLIMLFVGNAPMRETICKSTAGFYNHIVGKSYQSSESFVGFVSIGAFLIAIMFFLYGFGLSIYHLYTKREKTSFEKQAMLIFAVVTNICTALLAGIYLLRVSIGWTIIFPVWNLINAYLLMVLVQEKMINETCISGRKPTYHQILTGLTVIFVIFILCNFFFKLYWAITFSICIIYTASFNDTLQNVFPALKNKADEQTS